MQEIGERERGCLAISPLGLGEIWIFPLGTQMCSLFCGVVSHFYHLSAPYLSKLLSFLANWESCEQSWQYFKRVHFSEGLARKTENGKSANTKIRVKSVTRQKEKMIQGTDRALGDCLELWNDALQMWLPHHKFDNLHATEIVEIWTYKC